MLLIAVELDGCRLLFSSRLGRPPKRPRALAAANPALVRSRKSRSIGDRATDFIGDNFLAARLLKRIGLQVEVLFQSRDAGIANFHAYPLRLE